MPRLCLIGLMEGECCGYERVCRLGSKRRVRCSCGGRATGSSERVVRAGSRERLAKSWLREMEDMGSSRDCVCCAGREERGETDELRRLENVLATR